MEAVSTTTLRIFAAPATPILSKIVTKGLPALPIWFHGKRHNMTEIAPM